MFNIIIELNPKFIFKLFNNKYFIKTENFNIRNNFFPPTGGNNQNQYLFKEFDQYSLLILKFENIKNWGNIFNHLNIKYDEKSKNLTSNCDFYPIAQILYKNLKLFKLTTDKLKNIYSQYNNYLSNFYSNSEINEFIRFFSCDQSDINNIIIPASPKLKLVRPLSPRIQFKQIQSDINNINMQFIQTQSDINNLILEGPLTTHIQIKQKQLVIDNLNMQFKQKQLVINNLNIQFKQKQSELDNLNIKSHQKQSEIDNLNISSDQKQSELDNLIKYKQIRSKTIKYTYGWT